MGFPLPAHASRLLASQCRCQSHDHNDCRCQCGNRLVSEKKYIELAFYFGFSKGLINGFAPQTKAYTNDKDPMIT